MSSCKVCGMELPEGSGIICDDCLEELRMKTKPVFDRIPKRGVVPPASVNDVTMDEVQGNLMAQLAYEQTVRNHNVGESDYSKHKIQPWDIWIEYKLNPFDADIIKRVLRHKKTDTRKMDYEKIIHICQERIRQIDSGSDPWGDDND